jgi:hypothetical protein
MIVVRSSASPSSPAKILYLCYNIYIETTETYLNKFIEDYNLLFNVPNYKANVGICTEYRREHTNEFKTSDWAIEKHRKRFMDWMSKHSPSELELLSK